MSKSFFFFFFFIRVTSDAVFLLEWHLHEHVHLEMERIFCGSEFSKDGQRSLAPAFAGYLDEIAKWLAEMDVWIAGRPAVHHVLISAGMKAHQMGAENVQSMSSETVHDAFSSPLSLLLRPCELTLRTGFPALRSNWEGRMELCPRRQQG